MIICPYYIGKTLSCLISIYVKMNYKSVKVFRIMLIDTLIDFLSDLRASIHLYNARSTFSSSSIVKMGIHK